jgi:hypothetical protein
MNCEKAAPQEDPVFYSRCPDNDLGPDGAAILAAPIASLAALRQLYISARIAFFVTF